MNLADGSIRIFPKSTICTVEDGVQTCLDDCCWSLIRETPTVKTKRIAPNFNRERFFPTNVVNQLSSNWNVIYQTERVFLRGHYRNMILTEIVYFAKVCSMLCSWTCGCCPHLTNLHAPRVFVTDSSKEFRWSLVVVKSLGGHQRFQV